MLSNSVAMTEIFLVMQFLFVRHKILKGWFNMAGWLGFKSFFSTQFRTLKVGLHNN